MIHDSTICNCDLCRWAEGVEMHKDEFGRDVVPCDLCGKLTAMTSTKRCDRCWELETRIRMDKELAKEILARLEAESVAA